MSAADLLRARLAEGASRLARCWLVTRTDGVALGFTDHDRDLSFDGIVFRADSGLDAGALQRSTGLNVDNAQAVGALRSDAISEADILAGRYDGAEVRNWLVDWSGPEARIELFRGSIGEVRAGRGAFEAELRGQGEALNHPVGRAYLKTCDRALGDAKCGVDLSDPLYSAEASVLDAEGRLRIRWAPAGAYEEGWFEGGSLRWTAGLNAGGIALVREDRSFGGERWVTLWAEAALAIAAGDGFTITAGCDKHLDTCKEKFGNVLNFRGFPHMPGEDWVTAYPRSGDVHDGAALVWEEERSE